MNSTYPLFFLFFLLVSIPVSAAQSNSVMVVEISGTIDQSTVEIITEASTQAEQINAEAIVLLLDTPGGGLRQTFDIAALIQESEIPFIGFVAPQGSTAWSAGTFILLSCHVAAMAENTVIGSAQPVVISYEGTQTVNDSKTINALVEWLEERAAIYGRNRSVVGQFITKNLNLNETRAADLQVIEVIAEDVDALLDTIDGMNATTAAGNYTLNTAQAKQVMFSPSFKVVFLQIISDPVLTSLLLVIGIIALIFGIQSPGLGAEVFGVIAILLSLIGSGFAISVIAVVFLGVGILLLVIELFVTPGFGVVGIGGVICLIIGSIFLIPTYSNREWLITMDWINSAVSTMIVIVVIIAAFFVFLLYKIIEARKRKAATNVFVGQTAKTIDRISPGKKGYVRFKGELWHARSDIIIEPKTKVEIMAKEDSTLVVKPSQ